MVYDVLGIRYAFESYFYSLQNLWVVSPNVCNYFICEILQKISSNISYAAVCCKRSLNDVQIDLLR